MFFVGIDIAKNAHEATVIDEQGNTLVKPFKFKNSAAGFEKLSSSLNNLSTTISDFRFYRACHTAIYSADKTA